MCSPGDLGVFAETRSPFTGQATIFLYDAIPGGVGFAEKLYASHDLLIGSAEDLISSCPCDHGCPSCTGAPIGDGESAKAVALEMIRTLRTTTP